MKTIKLLFVLLLILAITPTTNAQSNQINYQGLAKDGSGVVLANETITLGIGIHFGSPTAALAYEEEHTVTTDANGVFSLQIGNGTVTIGTYNSLIWGSDSAFVTTSINGTELGTTELNAVPFALASANDVWTKNGANISNTNTGRVGIGTTSPGAKLMVVGEDTSTTTPAVNIANSTLTSLFHIKNGGRIGIGTTSPGAKLMVVGEDETATTPAVNITNSALTSLFHIKNDGKIGMGTTSPGAKLMVVGLGNTNATAALNIVNNASTSLFHIKDDGNIGVGTTAPAQKLQVVGTTQTDKLRLGDTGGNNIFWDIEEQANNGLTFTYGNEKARFTGSGRLGIGTATPGAKLMVVGEDTSITTPAVNITNSALTSLFHIKNGGRIGIGTTSPGAKLMVVGEDISATTPALNVANSMLNSLFHIKNDGKVGIGTTAPTQTLDVVGNVKATSFISSTTTYPDYVFENYYQGESNLNATYQFKTLEEIEKFIKENHHIEGYKSINELQKDENGNYIVNTSEQAIKNQEKIEELYLHTIELNKKIEQLEKLLNQLTQNYNKN